MCPVFNTHEVVLEGAHNLLTKGVLYIPKGVERERGRVVSVADERYFGSGEASLRDWEGGIPVLPRGSCRQWVRGLGKDFGACRSQGLC